MSQWLPVASYSHMWRQNEILQPFITATLKIEIQNRKQRELISYMGSISYGLLRLLRLLILPRRLPRSIPGLHEKRVK